MSFGVVQTMITTLKNNENLRSKREKFKRRYGHNSFQEKPEYDFPEATPEYLEEIRKKLKKENQILWIKITVISVVIIGCLLYLFFG